MKTKLRVSANKICSLEHAVNVISGKWKIPIVWHIQHGAHRPSDFFYRIAEINRRVLSRQLKELEDSGIIHKTVLRPKPLEVAYDLTPLGSRLVAILWQLDGWGKELLGQEPREQWTPFS